jgi:LVIVD repeat
MKPLLLFAVILLLNACNPDASQTTETVKGYRPIYASYETLRNVSSGSPQKLRKAGKIYTKGKYLYINEIGQGIHIYDNSDKTKPQAIAFISIPANQDISIADNILYADNADDLVAIDISNPLIIKVVKRIEKTFPYPSHPKQNGQFECVDPSKGYVVDWEYTDIVNPKCRR